MAQNGGDNALRFNWNERFLNASPTRLKNSPPDSGCDSFTSFKMSSNQSISMDSFYSPGPSKPSSNFTNTPSKVEDMANTGLWVFGYGSLCWNQGFEYSDTMTGYVTGFSRRFWQGNTTHRGTEGKPGRVATLVEDCEGKVWGQAFKVVGEAALPYLNNRECELGGYRTTLTTFHPRLSSTPPFPAILYIATPSNIHWLGESSLSSIAKQIVNSKGNSGHNVEYLLRLVEFIRATVPEAIDDHLFGLEALVLEEVRKRKMCLRTLMGETTKKTEHGDEAYAQEGYIGDQLPSLRPQQFSSRVPTKKLRCVNI